MKEQDFLAQYTAHLNKEQKAAVQAVDGPVLLLAVPGSGKTTVLVTRLGYLLLVKKVKPENILTLTYTVAATKDMAARFAGLFGADVAEKVEFRTINGLCQKILTYYGRMTGKTMYRLVTDDKELSRMVAEILREINEEFPTESEVVSARTQIAFCKNYMLTREEIVTYAKKIAWEDFPKVYARYEQIMKAQQTMDYDDQMVYAYRLLQLVPEVLEEFQEQYRYLCVDEAQDTSKIQHAIIALLAGKRDNLFMVGDEDQSIYGFRAAYPEALLRFEQEHSGARVLVMTQNYRSDANIVVGADAVIQHNKARHAKHMKAVHEAKQSIHYVTLARRRGQYGYLMKVAREATQEVAVLYRDNESAIPLVDMLDREHIPYRVKSGDVSFFTNRVVMDIVSILQFGFQPKNTELFYSIYYKLGLYVTKQQAAEMCRISRERDCPVLEAIEHMYNVKGNVLGNCRSIRSHYQHMMKEEPAKAISRIRKFMGYGDYLKRVELDDGKMRTLLELAYREKSVGSFLRRIPQLQELFQYGGFKDAKLLLSTIHSSKGLEYEQVFLMDAVDGILPKKNVDGRPLEPEEIEEERRLFYVGMTRAKKRLHIFTFEEEPSKFVKEIKRRVKEETPKGAVDFVPETGMAVCHKAFGEGKIADVQYEGKRPVSVVVSFGSGMKKFAFPMVFENGYMWRK